MPNEITLGRIIVGSGTQPAAEFPGVLAEILVDDVLDLVAVLGIRNVPSAAAVAVKCSAHIDVYGSVHRSSEIAVVDILEPNLVDGAGVDGLRVGHLQRVFGA